jgi:outer membrane receptor for ferric coprogen and ferric-rhodotorulic acid
LPWHAFEEDPVPAGSGAASQHTDEIVVVGKSYGQEVGETVTPLKDVPNTITVNGVGGEDSSYFSLGFAMSNYLVDGVPALAFGFPGVVPDLFGL